MLTTALVVTGAIIVDRIFGEPRAWHPLEALGRLFTQIEHRLHAEVTEAARETKVLQEASVAAANDLTVVSPSGAPPAPSSQENKEDPFAEQMKQRKNGVGAVLIAVVPLCMLTLVIESIKPISFAFDVLILYLAIGSQSLREHSLAVAAALKDGDLVEARHAVSKIVSRECAGLDETQICCAAIESVLENGSDAVFAAVFWFIVLGAPGVVLYRIVNTLDAMWGYRNARYEHFGWAAAKLDDLLNWIPARLTALTYALLGNSQNAIWSWQNQGGKWYSPNAGPVMSSGAGALDLQLGGPATYHGKLKERLVLGRGRAPNADDILRALHMVDKGLLVWPAVLLVLCAVTSLR